MGLSGLWVVTRPLTISLAGLSLQGHVILLWYNHWQEETSWSGYLSEQAEESVSQSNSRLLNHFKLIKRNKHSHFLNIKKELIA